MAAPASSIKAVIAALSGNAFVTLVKFISAASITVGVLLGLIAIYLVLANRELLLGRAVPEDVELRFVSIIRARKSIADIHDVKTRQLTPESFTFKAEIRFSEAFIAERLAEALPAGGLAQVGDARERGLQDMARHLIRVLSEEVDAIETDVRAVIPEARHIDLELEHLPTSAPVTGAVAPRSA
jgi:zinc transporter 9